LPQAEGYRSVRTIGRSAVDPSSEMLAVGCTVSSAVASPTAVRILPRLGRPDIFECAGVASDSVSAGIRRYLDATIAVDGDASLMAGTWTFESREYCYATGGWWQSDGTFYLPEGERLEDCFWMDTMTFVPNDFSGEWPRIPIPPGGGGGPIANPGTTTPPVTPVTDSATMEAEYLAAETDDTGLSEGVWQLTDLENLQFSCRDPARKCPRPSLYRTSPAVISAAAGMVAATAADGLERGAWLFRNADGTIRVGPWHTGNIWGTIPTLAGNLMPPDAIGMIHSHPQEDPPSGPDAGLALETGTYVTIVTTKQLFLLDPHGKWVYTGARPIQ
jgi:hypothetical protein